MGSDRAVCDMQLRRNLFPTFSLRYGGQDLPFALRQVELLMCRASFRWGDAASSISEQARQSLRLHDHLSARRRPNCAEQGLATAIFEQIAGATGLQPPDHQLVLIVGGQNKDGDLWPLPADTFTRHEAWYSPWRYSFPGRSYHEHQWDHHHRAIQKSRVHNPSDLQYYIHKVQSLEQGISACVTKCPQDWPGDPGRRDAE